MAETFGDKLKQMRSDLSSIVTRMNKDFSYSCAQKAQTALIAVATLEEEIDGHFSGADELEWDWEPQSDG